jgi:hypothetical protein
MLRTVRRRLKYAFAMVGADRYAAAENYAAARAKLTDWYASRGETGPSDGAPAEANVRYASLSQRVGELHAAYEGCVVAIRQLKEGRVRLAEAEKKYLLFYCKWILSLTTKFIDSEAFSLAVSTGVRYADVSVKDVRPRLRRRFPIGDENGEALDTYFAENEAALAGA